MSRPIAVAAAQPPAAVRCAIYTRKSTDEGLDQEFNSLDAQRESAEAFIASQQHEGWRCLPDRYDDGGYSGGTMDRPALRRLLADIEAGNVDCVVVYKVDRLSRSLLDFARILETFERHRVSFVSVTQQFNTATSMGRLMLNVLLSFAQFEREMISERTRDKMAAARRKGKYVGGRPILGYDVVDTKLVVNQDEAKRVRQAFELYLQHQSLLPVVKELARRGWTTKRWTTKRGTPCGGQPLTKNRLYQLLTNVAYIGKVQYKGEIHQGEHQAIVDQEVFRQVQAALKRNGRGGGVRSKHGALLRGLLRCASCGCGMAPTYTAKGQRRYRYYVCVQAQQRGWQTCPSPSVPAGQIEAFIVHEIKCIGRDPALVAATLAETQHQVEEAIKRLERERAALQRQRRDDEGLLRRLACTVGANGDRLARLADVQERLRLAEQRLTEINEQMVALSGNLVDEEEVAQALAEFDQVWSVLAPGEQARILNLLVERIDYDGPAGNVSIKFRPTGIKSLAAEISGCSQEEAG